jgi:hypothetical protein
MKKYSITTKTIALVLLGSVLFTSCTSTTMITSTPSGAKLYLNGEPVGKTPFYHSDTRIVGSTTHVKLEMLDHETLNTSFSRDEEVDVGAIIGGLFFLLPFLWTMKYKPVHHYELKPALYMDVPYYQNPSGSKVEKLRELKQLLDENLISNDDYEREKNRILAEY